MGLLEIGSSALKAASIQLQTTGNNVANATTPGYHREVVSQSDNGARRTGSGYIGMGVQIDTIRRSYDSFLERAVGIGEASAASDKSRLSQMSAMESLFSDSETGVGAAMNDLRTALAELVNSPTDSSTRTVVLNRAEALAQRINGLDGKLGQMASDNAQRVGSEVNALNDTLKQLADVNQKIIAADVRHTPNDLHDQRDLLISKINGYASANAYINDNGTADLFSISGEPMVLGGEASTFTVTADLYNSGLPQLNLKTLGRDLPMDAAALGGGSIVGLMRFQADDLASARARLGQMAAAIGDVFNTVQANGIDSTGQAGKAMFSWTDPIAISASTNDGSAQLGVTVTDPSALAASDYLVTYDGTQFIARRQSDGVETALSAMPQEVDGLTLALDAGTAQVGDRFLIKSASNFASTFRMDLGTTNELAIGLAVTPQVNGTNTGSGAVDSFKVSDSSDPNLTGLVTLVFDGAGRYNVVGAGTGDPTNVAYQAGQPISYNGWTMTVKGSPAAGDTITLGATTSPSTDNRNARALYEATDAALVGGQSLNDAYADLVADVGSRARQATVASNQSSAMLTHAKEARDSVSGVNLDEEAARMIQLQQAYQAAARLISTSQSLFSTLIEAVA